MMLKRSIRPGCLSIVSKVGRRIRTRAHTSRPERDIVLHDDDYDLLIQF
jgi:hypothetical protein